MFCDLRERFLPGAACALPRLGACAPTTSAAWRYSVHGLIRDRACGQPLRCSRGGVNLRALGSPVLRIRVIECPLVHARCKPAALHTPLDLMQRPWVRMPWVRIKCPRTSSCPLSAPIGCGHSSAQCHPVRTRRPKAPFLAVRGGRAAKPCAGRPGAAGGVASCLCRDRGQPSQMSAAPASVMIPPARYMRMAAPRQAISDGLAGL